MKTTVKVKIMGCEAQLDAYLDASIGYHMEDWNYLNFSNVTSLIYCITYLIQEMKRMNVQHPKIREYLGRIGFAIAKRAEEFSCTINYHSRTKKQSTNSATTPMPLIWLQTALTDEARHIVNRENVVLLPHVGTDTVEASDAMADLVVANLESHFLKKPLLTPVI
ncbi:hypothetical protein C2S53_020219 [Perilla frutescens var. hirtella]|uniref:Uncharacterized protein n=1 Tax=Perilla frutescens var. hirtella TaxID=608512 RepID=A0AAD4JH17_PERFH|nr:hypothetical protein C2S53_020219 [Perilla frutescens var. hirtella]